MARNITLSPNSHNELTDQSIAFSDHIERLLGLDQFATRRLSVYVCERTWSWNPPVFNDFDFWLVLAGEGTLRVNGTPYPLGPGVGFLLQPGDTVVGSQKPEAPLTVFACHIDPARRLGNGGRLTPSGLHFVMSDPASFEKQAREALRAQESGRDGPAPSLVKGLVAGMVLRALLGSEKGPASPTAIQKLALDIRAEPGRDWSLEVMARRCFLSVPQYTRTFRRTYGTSPRQFVISQRIRRAIDLLRESQTSIQEIATSLGYADHFFFHRQFKSLTGVTPLEARKGTSTKLAE